LINEKSPSKDCLPEKGVSFPKNHKFANFVN